MTLIFLMETILVKKGQAEKKIMTFFRFMLVLLAIASFVEFCSLY